MTTPYRHGYLCFQSRCKIRDAFHNVFSSTRFSSTCGTESRPRLSILFHYRPFHRIPYLVLSPRAYPTWFSKISVRLALEQFRFETSAILTQFQRRSPYLISSSNAPAAQRQDQRRLSPFELFVAGLSSTSTRALRVPLYHRARESPSASSASFRGHLCLLRGHFEIQSHNYLQARLLCRLGPHGVEQTLELPSLML